MGGAKLSLHLIAVPLAQVGLKIGETHTFNEVLVCAGDVAFFIYTPFTSQPENPLG